MLQEASYPSDDGPRPALLARPPGWGGGGAIFMVHENRGLTEYMTQVVEELCGLDYVVMAPDLMSRHPHPGADDATTRDLPESRHAADLVAGLNRLESMPGVERVAVVGFCFGGEMAMRTALDRTELAAVVSWYGVPPDTVDIPRLHAPLLAILAQHDDRVNRHTERLMDGLAAHGLDHLVQTYLETQHAFHDRYRPERFHPSAAAAAWHACVTFLRVRLDHAGQAA